MSESVRAGLSAPLERLAKGLALGDLVLVLLDLYVHRGRHLSPAVSNGAVDFDKPDRFKNSKVVADLATLISSARSSAGQAFTYDVAECELWLKPLWLKVWLTAAKTRKFNE